MVVSLNGRANIVSQRLSFEPRAKFIIMTNFKVTYLSHGYFVISPKKLSLSIKQRAGNY